MVQPPYKKPKTQTQTEVIYKIPCIDEHQKIISWVLSKYKNNVKRYSTDEGYCVNRCLRKGSLDKQVLNLYERLMKAFDESVKFKTDTNLYLYRGLQCGGNILGSSFVDLGFVSTSIVIDVARKFAHPSNNIMKIMLMPGMEYKLLPIERVSDMPKEFEILLPPKGYFHYCGMGGAGGEQYYKYVYFPEKPDNTDEIQFVDLEDPSTSVLKQLLNSKTTKEKQSFENVLQQVKKIVDEKGFELSDEDCEDICVAYLFS